MKGLLGKNLGMTQKFNDKGELVPVTAIKCGPCAVIQRKTVNKEGYSAVQLGFEEVKKLQRVNKATKGHFQKAGTPVFKHTFECRVDDSLNIKVGDVVDAGLFETGDLLSIKGRSKGRGFQGVVKRYGHSGGGAAHGSHFHRAPGSIGQNSSPSRVIPGMKMPGHMGNNDITIKNIELIEIDRENNLIFVKGSVPGCKNSMVNITALSADISARINKVISAKTAETSPAAAPAAEQPVAEAEQK